MQDNSNNIKDLILYILACYKIKTFIIIKRYYYVKMYFEILKNDKYILHTISTYLIPIFVVR